MPRQRSSDVEIDHALGVCAARGFLLSSCAVELETDHSCRGLGTLIFLETKCCFFVLKYRSQALKGHERHLSLKASDLVCSNVFMRSLSRSFSVPKVN